MAVPEQIPYIEFVANGVTKVFPLGFVCKEQNHLSVLVDDNESRVGEWQLDDANNIIFLKAPAKDSKLKFQRKTPFQRERNYQSYNNSFRPDPVNNDFDDIWFKLQELGFSDILLATRIDNLKKYIYEEDEALKAYLLKAMHLQGVSLEQLQNYYEYLLGRLAQLATEKGWDASLIVDGVETQHEINEKTIRTVESVSDLLRVSKLFNSQTVFVKGYYKAINFALLQPYKGGGKFIFNNIKSNINDGFLIFNGWVRQFESNTYTPYMSGCKCDGITDDTLNLDKMLYILEQNKMQGIVEFTETLFVNSYSPRTGKKWEAYNYVIRLVDNVWFDIKGTIKIGSFFDNKEFYLLDGRGFLDVPEDKGLGLVLFYNIKIYGGGTIDGTSAGMMHKNNLKRIAIGTGNIVDFEICDLTFKGGRYQNTIWVHFLSMRGSIHHCNFLDQYPDGDACNDHSSIYTCGYCIEVNSNKFTQNSISGKLNSSCIEIHNSNTTLRDNYSVGYRVFAYIAVINLPFEGQDNIRDNILIENNTAFNCMQFFSIWSGYGEFKTHKKIGHITVKDNKLICFTDDDKKLVDFLAVNPIAKHGVSNNTEFWNNLPSMYSFFFVEGSQQEGAPNTQKLLTGDYTRIVVKDNYADLTRGGKNKECIFYNPRYKNIEHNVHILGNEMSTNIIAKFADFSGLIKYYDLDGFTIKGNKFDYNSLSAFCIQGAVGSLQNIDIDIFLESPYHDSEDKFQFGNGLLCKNTAAKIRNVSIKSGSTFGNVIGYFLNTSILSAGQNRNIHIESDMNIIFTLYKNGSAYAQDQGLLANISKANIVRIKNKSQYSSGLSFHVNPTVVVGTDKLSALSTRHSMTLIEESIIVDTITRVSLN